MSYLIASLGLLALFVFAMMWAGKKAGDAVSGKAAKEDLNDVVEANAPVDVSMRERLRARYRKP